MAARSISILVFLAASASCIPATPGAEAASTQQGSLTAEADFTLFESGQVRPLAMSPNGKLLFATNTPDNRLEIFRPHRGGMTHVASVPVGLEPVAVAARSSSEVWVVNHLSDSVSVVDVDNPEHAFVRRTLQVGDEPRDIVFAGPGRSRAFVTTAHRGQNTQRDPQLTVPGVGRADVWVFDSDNLGDSLLADPLTVLTLFTDTPRALATSPDGATVYAAGFLTGNRTTAVHERLVTNGPGLPPPLVTTSGVQTPQNGLIVRYDGTSWRDAAGRNFDSMVKFSLPDLDVFAIDANASPPAQKIGTAGAYAGVGTVLFNMAVNPVSGKIYVSNTEARNEVRFEGHNEAGDGTSVRGHFAENRITVLDDTTVTPRHLNTHLDFSRDGTPAENQKSLAFPMDMAVSSDGAKLYVTAFGSSKVAVFDTAALEAGTFVPSLENQIQVSGGGPSGVVLDEARGALYVLTRFDNSISVIDTATKVEKAHVAMFNPEPTSVQRGRRFLYDASHTSSHGDSACASCHVFGDFDALAWDLGDPDGELVINPGPFKIPTLGQNPDFHPLKGPMTTQSLRGMANHGPMHWRGDRTGGNDEPSAQPDEGTFDEDAAFKKFQGAFPGLLGRAAELPAEEMQAFTDFILQVTYPPNPIRNLDNSLTADQEAGRAFFFNHTPSGAEIPSDTFRNCNGCHVLDPSGNPGAAKPGFFGSDGSYSFEAESQFMKVPHMRNMYQKVGMFGMANTFGLPIDASPRRLAFLPPPFNDTSFQGDQVRGFGFTHDGSVDTLFRFFGANVFAQRAATATFPGNLGGIPLNADGMRLRRQLEAFSLVFDSNLAPIVGQQATFHGDNDATVLARIALLKERARAGDCELVAHAVDDRDVRGFLYQPSTDSYVPDSEADSPLSEAALLQKADADAPVTYTAVPVRSGQRMGRDRDLDGVLDSDEDSDD